MKSKTWIWVVIATLVIAVIGWWLIIFFGEAIFPPKPLPSITPFSATDSQQKFAAQYELGLLYEANDEKSKAQTAYIQAALAEQPA